MLKSSMGKSLAKQQSSPDCFFTFIYTDRNCFVDALEFIRFVLQNALVCAGGYWYACYSKLELPSESRDRWTR